jgi:hypothetical protein
LVGKRAEPQSFGGVERQRLFAQHVLAGREGALDHGRQVDVRHAGVDGVDAWHGKQLVQ